MAMRIDTQEPTLLQPVENPQETSAATGAPQWVKLAGLAALLVSLLVYVLRLDRVVGLFVDDAWYVLLAKALGTGQGYTLTNSPTPGILPLYPPAFPFVLSFIFRIWASFPDNLQLLKGVSIAAMLGVGVLAYRYFTHYRAVAPPLALGIAAATVLCPMLVFLATSTVMSECFFTLILLSLVVVVERCVKAGATARGWQWAALAALLASTAFLTRSIAAAVALAAFGYLLKERVQKSALIFAAIVGAICLPWLIYTRVHTPTPEQQKEQGGHIVQPYTTQFWQRRAGFAGSGTVTVGDLPERVWDNLTSIAGRDVARIVAAPIFEALRDPYEEAKRADVRAGGAADPLFFSFVLSALVILGFVVVARRKVTFAEVAVPASLGVTALWPWETVRFVLPLAPFLIFYLLEGCGALVGLYQKRRQTGAERQQRLVVGAVAALLVAINLFANVNYILKASNTSTLDRPQWLQTFDEIEALLKWTARDQTKGPVLATSNPALAHLYTDSKTIGNEDPAGNWANWNRLGVRYLAHIPAYPEPLDPAEAKYKTVYHSRTFPHFRVIDLGPVEGRAVWEGVTRRPYEAFRDRFKFLPLIVLLLWFVIWRAAAFWQRKPLTFLAKPAVIFAVYTMLLLLLALTSMRQKATTTDEVTHIPAGYTNLAFHDYRMNPEHPPFVKWLSAVPLRFFNPKVDTNDVDWAKNLSAGDFGYKFLFAWNDADRMTFWARVPIVLLALLLGVAIWFCAWELYGWKAGCVALLLYLFNPDFLAHGQLVTTDVGVSCFLFLSVYTFYRALQRLTIWNALLFGASVGLVLITKYSGVFVFPVLALVALVFAFSNSATELKLKASAEGVIKTRGGKLAAAAGLIVASALIGLVMIWACYGFRYRISPDPAISQRMDWQRYWNQGGLMNNLGKVAKEWRIVPESYVYGLLYVPLASGKRFSFLLGELSSDQGWWYYFLITILVKTPIPLLLMILLGFLFMRRYGAGLTAEAMLLIPVAIFLGLAMINSINIGHRHILPIYPFLIVFASKAVRFFDEPRKRVWAAAYSLLLAWYIAGTVWLYPHFLAYFNEIAGGPNGGYEWLADSNIDWGQDLKALGEYRRQHPNEPLYLAYFGMAKPEYYGLQPNYIAALNNEVLHGRELSPLNPPSGSLVAVSASSLQCVFIRNAAFPGIEQFMASLKQMEPIAKLGYSIFIYRMP